MVIDIAKPRLATALASSIVPEKSTCKSSYRSAEHEGNCEE